MRSLVVPYTYAASDGVPCSRQSPHVERLPLSRWCMFQTLGVGAVEIRGFLPHQAFAAHQAEERGQGCEVQAFRSVVQGFLIIK